MTTTIQEKILLNAFELFVNKGYSATTIDEIAKKTNVSKGLVYYYYKNKKQLLKAVIDLIKMPTSRLNPEEFKNKDVYQIFDHIIHAHYQYIEELRALCQSSFIKLQRFYFEALSLLPEYYEQIQNNYAKAMDAIRQSLKKTHNYSDEQIELFIIFLFSMLEVMFYYSSIFPNQDLRNYIEMSKKLLRKLF